MTESAIYSVNRMIESDSILKSILGREPLNVFPGFAGEPMDGDLSHPYIRYLSVPLISRETIHIRRDNVQYVVGAKDLTIISRAIERLIYILQTNDGFDELTPDYDGRYKIYDIIIVGGTPQTLPSQDEGVWEQGINCTIVYTIVSPGWGLTTKKQVQIDALLG